MLDAMEKLVSVGLHSDLMVPMADVQAESNFLAGASSWRLTSEEQLADLARL